MVVSTMALSRGLEVQGFRLIITKPNPVATIIMTPKARVLVGMTTTALPTALAILSARSFSILIRFSVANLSSADFSVLAFGQTIVGVGEY